MADDPSGWVDFQTRHRERKPRSSTGRTERGRRDKRSYRCPLGGYRSLGARDEQEDLGLTMMRATYESARMCACVPSQPRRPGNTVHVEGGCGSNDPGCPWVQGARVIKAGVASNGWPRMRVVAGRDARSTNRPAPHFRCRHRRLIASGSSVMVLQKLGRRPCGGVDMADQDALAIEPFFFSPGRLRQSVSSE